MAIASRKFQAPRGTRDFYPQDMAVRRYIENVWRTTSINHGFDEIEGPTFEHLELYTHKSGPGIANELFQVSSGKDEEQLAAIRAGQTAPYALRPEFTPTLARMVAAKANSLPMPIKWFAIPSHFRAERPQRGRLREFVQWNVDFIGVPETGLFEAEADVEVLTVLVRALENFGLSPDDVRIKLGHREAVTLRLLKFGRTEEQIQTDLELLDRRFKIPVKEYRNSATNFGWPKQLTEFFDPERRQIVRLDADVDQLDLSDQEKALTLERRATPGSLNYEIERSGLGEWCEFDSMIIRGLAYYTGVIFEAHEASGDARAIAGGGRYDQLIHHFGGPLMRACGFGMGDVVLGNLLHDKGLLPEEVYMKPLRPHAFAIAAGDEADPRMRQEIAKLRREGFHIRHSYKTTRNVGKLLGEAGKSRALSAIIFGKDLADNRVDLKDLQSGTQETIDINQLATKLKELDAR